MRKLLPLAAVVAAVSPLAAQPVADILDNLESGPIPVQERLLPVPLEISFDGSLQHAPLNVYDYFRVYNSPGPVVRFTFGEALSDENASVDVQLFWVGKENTPIEDPNAGTPEDEEEKDEAVPNPPLNLVAPTSIISFLGAISDGLYQDTLIHLALDEGGLKVVGAGAWKPEPDDAYYLVDYIGAPPSLASGNEVRSSFPRNKGSLMFQPEMLGGVATGFSFNLTDNSSVLAGSYFATSAAIGWVGNGLQASSDEQLKPLLDLLGYERHTLNDTFGGFHNLWDVPLKGYTSGRAKQEHQLWIKDVSIAGGLLEERPQVSVKPYEEGDTTDLKTFHEFLDATIDEDGFLTVSVKAKKGSEIYGDTTFYGTLKVQSSSSKPEITTENYFLVRISVTVHSEEGLLLGFAEESAANPDWYRTPIGWVWSGILPPATERGTLIDATGGWVFHSEHGWIYVMRGENATLDDIYEHGYYIYARSGVIGSNDDFGWLWTRPGVYPTIYSYAFATREGATVNDGWLLYVPRSGKVLEDRWFFQWSKAYQPFPVEWPEEIRYGAHVRTNGEVVPASEINPPPTDPDGEE